MKTSALHSLAISAIVVTGIVFHPSAMHAQQTTDIWLSGASPAATIKLKIDGIIVAKGTYNSYNPVLAPEAEGDGVRMFWYPGKAAFRAGYATYGVWDNYNIGWYSSAFGYNRTATGYYSFAAGINSSATGWAPAPIALGSGASTGSSGLAAIGKSASSNNYSIALGQGVSATANSTSVGQYSTASGYFSAAFGSYNVADGSNATALGYHTTARAYGSTVVGMFNVPRDPAAPVATDPVFVVGSGTGAASPADAFTVYKNGDAYFSKTLRVEARGDISMGQFTAQP